MSPYPPDTPRRLLHLPSGQPVLQVYRTTDHHGLPAVVTDWPRGARITILEAKLTELPS